MFHVEVIFKRKLDVVSTVVDSGRQNHKCKIRWSRSIVLDFRCTCLEVAVTVNGCLKF